MNGYVRCPHALLCNPAVSDTELRVWLFIAGQQDGARVTAEQAAQAIGKSRRAWYYTVNRLKELGLIEITHFRGSNVASYKAVLTGLNASETVQNIAQSTVQKTARSCATNCTVVCNELHGTVQEIARSHLINSNNNLSLAREGGKEKERETSPFEEDIETRRKKFYEDVKKLVTPATKQKCYEFFQYWSETMRDGKRMRFEAQDAWDLGARLDRFRQRD